MKKQITIVGGVYFDLDHGPHCSEYKFFTGFFGGFSQYVPVMEHTITVELPDGFQPQVAEIAALEAMREEARNKFAETVRSIDLRISKLQAIGNEVEA